MHTDPVRLACAAVLLAVATGGCAELGPTVIGDGTSVSVGKPSGGYLVDAKRLPDSGDGFKTQEVWRTRNNRYGTDELLDLIVGVGRRMATQVTDVKLVVADLSSERGGAARAWHRSHQSGRDVDLVYYMRGADGKPWEADAMRVFDANARAKDGSGITVDVPRMWLVVKALITAPEARVQWIFMYEPIAAKVIEQATKLGEPEALIARARKTLKQPGDSARHDDHFHVRVYCSDRDREFGCVDIGPMELYAEREAEARSNAELGRPLPTAIATLLGSATQVGASTMLHIDALPWFRR
jgi:penicillin-insensitive murein endopeptidase